MKAIRRFVMLALILSLAMSLAVGASAIGPVVEENNPTAGNEYYLMTTIDGADYYFRDNKTGESVTSTAPYSVYLTNDPEDASIKLLKAEALGAGFALTFPRGDNIIKIYAFDTSKSGTVDTGSHANNGQITEGKHDWLYDTEQQYLYRDIDGVKYVLVAKKLLSSLSAVEEWRMLAVPAAEVGADKGTYPMQLVKPHTCSFGDDWASDENSHWHPCECGEKQGVALHDMGEWTTTKEPAAGVEGSKSAKCTVCGYEVTETIEALPEETAAPTTDAPTTGNQDNNGSDAQPASMNAWLIAAVVVLFLGGVAFMIFGKKK